MEGIVSLRRAAAFEVDPDESAEVKDMPNDWAQNNV